MTLGELIYHVGGGVVCGSDTDRVVANCSHEQEAESFVEFYNENHEGE